MRVPAAVLKKVYAALQAAEKHTGDDLKNRLVWAEIMSARCDFKVYVIDELQPEPPVDLEATT